MSEQGISIPLRRLTIYQLDNGRKIEEWKKVASVMATNSDNIDQELAKKDVLFVGVATVPIPMPSSSNSNEIKTFPKEVRFAIEADSLENAFNGYDHGLSETVRSLRENLQQHKDKVS